eukprot:GDKI01032768.1.p1 GENE.GDKI01032768.1~~GDKI01032768.1.p1  ORF type:complete len:116 (+),score=16.25 GDKI01032768.1:103-450(+)
MASPTIPLRSGGGVGPIPSVGQPKDVVTELDRKLQESGERDELIAWIRERLVKSGWRDDLKQHCIDYIRARGVERVTVDDIMSAVRPRAKATVPDDVRAELLAKVRQFAESHVEP